MPTETKSPITMEVIPPKRDLDGVITWVRIRQTVTYEVEIPIMRGKGHWCCRICGKAPPLPDQRGAEFILDNHDGERLIFPQDEDVEPERDRYPVTGWKKVKIGSNLEAILCPECLEEHWLGRLRKSMTR